jgi:hypothetical protein
VEGILAFAERILPRASDLSAYRSTVHRKTIFTAFPARCREREPSEGGTGWLTSPLLIANVISIVSATGTGEPSFSPASKRHVLAALTASASSPQLESSDLTTRTSRTLPSAPTLVTLNFASWNRVATWLQRRAARRRVAS